MKSLELLQKKQSLNQKMVRVLINFLIYILAAVFIMPFYISIVTALKSPQETAESVLALPKVIQWGNITEALRITNFSTAFINSCITTFFSILLIVICSSMAGYAIARNYRGRLFKTYEMVLLASLMLPFQTIMIPVYRMLKAVSLLNSLPGAIIIMAGTSIPFSAFLYIGFVKSIPKELEESATIDGCGQFRMFWQIVFPLLKPITSTIATLHFLWLWNEFNISLIVLQKENVRTIPIQQYVFFGQYTTNINLAFASACIAMIPILIFFISAQKFIVKGLTEGAVKG